MRLTDLAGQVDFALACYMVHELPAGNRFFAEVGRGPQAGWPLLLLSRPVT